MHTAFKTLNCQTKTGVVEGDNTPIPGELTKKQQTTKPFAQIIHKQGERGIGSGLEQSARWKEGSSSNVHGNSSNTAAVASSAASSVCIHSGTRMV
jgi:hypothetical protein